MPKEVINAKIPQESSIQHTTTIPTIMPNLSIFLRPPSNKIYMDQLWLDYQLLVP